MLLERISYDLSDEQYNQLAQAIRDFDGLLTFAINLTIDERKRLLKMGDKTIAFVEKAVQFARERSDLVPSYLDMIKCQGDFKLARQLKELLNLMAPVVEKISDTSLAAGIDAFSAAREFYNYVKTAARAGTPGSDSIASELKKRYELRRRKDNLEKKDDNVETKNNKK